MVDSDDLPGHGATAVAIGPDGTAYAATDSGSILVHDDSGWTSHAAPSGDIESLAVTVDGTVWAGTAPGGGLYSFDGTGFTEYDLDNVFPDAEEVTNRRTSRVTCDRGRGRE